MIKACRKRLIFSLLLAFLIPASGSFWAADDFEPPNSYIGNADWDGSLVLWMDVAQIPLPDGTFLPLRLRFTSKGEDSLLGKHWMCPLLESTAILPKNHFISFSNPWGGGGYLVRRNQFVSDDGQTKATIIDAGIDVNSAGWTFRYQNGKIIGAKTPKGTPLVWKYADNGDLTGLQTGEGKELLQVIRAIDCVQIVIPNLKGDFSLARTLTANGDLAGWMLTYPEGRKEQITLINENGVTRMTRSDGTTYRWDTKTGALLADRDFTYVMRPTDIGRDLLNRVDSQGLTEWYYYDSDKGAATYKRQDGSRVVSWYDLKRGPTNMKVFRMDTISEDQKLVSSRLLSYTPEGEVEKEWTVEGTPGNNSSRAIRFIRLDEAMSLHAEAGTLFIDARHPVAFRAGSIPGALNISRTNFERDYEGKDSLLKGAKTLVVYCMSRNCEDSSIVATKLQTLGCKNVVVFDGGWAEWWKKHR